ncbi:MAG: sporulation protein Cse60 [Bacilli bacterium]
MKVKIFDENHEKDLENSVNSFLLGLSGDIIDIKFQVSIGVFAEEQIYCYSAMILYSENH